MSEAKIYPNTIIEFVKRLDEQRVASVTVETAHVLWRNSERVAYGLYVRGYVRDARYREPDSMSEQEMLEYFPQLAPIMKWDNWCFSEGPMYYIENTLYHMGLSAYPDAKNMDHVRSYVACGAFDGDEEALAGLMQAVESAASARPLAEIEADIKALTWEPAEINRFHEIAARLRASIAVGAMDGWLAKDCKISDADSYNDWSELEIELKRGIRVAKHMNELKAEYRSANTGAREIATAWLTARLPRALDRMCDDVTAFVNQYGNQ